MINSSALSVHTIFRGNLPTEEWDSNILRATGIPSDAKGLHHFLDVLFLPFVPVVGRQARVGVKVDLATSLAFGEYWSRAIGKAVLVCFGSTERVASVLQDQDAWQNFLLASHPSTVVRDCSSAGIRGVVLELPALARDDFQGLP
jgi:hypothetical protein